MPKVPKKGDFEMEFIDNKKHKLFLKNGVEQIVFFFKDNFDFMDHKNTVEYVEKLLKQINVPQDKAFQLTFFYDDNVSFNITHKGFTKLNNGEKLKDKTISFFSQYQTREEQVEDIITGFALYTIPITDEEGGKTTDNQNNCLWKALKTRFGDKLKYSTPYKMKQILGLANDAKVPVKMLPKLEEKLKCNIVVDGDASYQGNGSFIHTVKLSIRKSHYELEMTDTFKKMGTSSFKNEKPLIAIRRDGNEYECYSKEGYSRMPLKKSVIRENYCMIYVKDNVSLESEFNRMNDEYELLKSISNGKLNPYKYTSLPGMAMSLFYNQFNTIEPDAISPLESMVLKEAGRGGLRFADGNALNKKFKGYSYDINRFYPHLMTKQIVYPVKKPDFVKLTELPKSVKLGVYRCDIIDESGFFQGRQTCYYTNYDIVMARLSGATIELKTDGDWNAMIYNGKGVKIDSIKSTMNELYRCSQEGSKIAKLIANSMWGRVSKLNKTFFYSHKKAVNLKYDDNLKCCLDKQRTTEVERIDKYNAYENNWGGRISTFLTAYGRYNLYKIIHPFKEHIKYIHTDGWITDKKMTDIKLSNDFGGIRLDKKGKVVIHNKNQYEFLS
jgi:hypothetical protein